MKDKPDNNHRKKLNGSKSYHHGDLRQSLLSAAAALINEGGVHALTMRELADRVGVSRTALYHHFDGKQALLFALAEDGFIRQGQQLLAVMQDADRLPPRALLKQYISAYIDFAVHNPASYGLMFGAEIWQTAEPDDALTDIGRRAFKQYLMVIHNWQQQGIIHRRPDTLSFAQVSWATMHGLCRLLIDGIYIDQQPRESMIDTIVDLFVGRLAS